jgi:hypothetical protein
LVDVIDLGHRTDIYEWQKPLIRWLLIYSYIFAATNILAKTFQFIFSGIGILLFW